MDSYRLNSPQQKACSPNPGCAQEGREFTSWRGPTNAEPTYASSVMAACYPGAIAGGTTLRILRIATLYDGQGTPEPWW